MREQRLINFRENTFVWLLLLYFSAVGLGLAIGRFLLWNEFLRIIEFFFSPDKQLGDVGVAFINQIIIPFMLFHIGLGVTGWILFFTKPWLINLEFLHVDKTEHVRFNFFITSSLLAIYLFGLFNIPELISGLRLPFYREDSLFETLTAAALFVSGVLLFLVVFYVRKDTQTPQKTVTIVIFLFLCLVVFIAAGEEISWGQRIFTWETPRFFRGRNIQDETNLHNFLSNLQKEHFEFGIGISVSIILFGSWIVIKDSYRDRLSMLIPPLEMFIPAILMLASSGHSEELFEEMTTLFILMYSIWIWNQWRLRIRKAL